MPKFSGEINFQKHILNSYGISAAQRILCALGTCFIDIDYCPVICDLVPILLCFLSEEDSFRCASWMIQICKQDAFFFACTAKQSVAQSLAFANLVKKKLPLLFHCMFFLFFLFVLYKRR